MDDIWKLVQTQHAAIARWQLAAAGKSRYWVDRRVHDGDLVVATPHVLVVPGAPATPEQRLMVGVLDGGPGSLVTMRSSAWLWQVPSFTPGPVDVIRGRNDRRAIAATSRWPRHIPPHHVTTVRGIPTLTLARTMFELMGDPQVAPRIPRLIDTIDGKSPHLLIALHQLLPEVATKGKPGITRMRETLASRPPDRTRLTGNERRFEFILRRAGLPIPRRQVDIGGHSWIGRVDYLDEPNRVIFEIDSEIHHVGLLDRLDDERRDNEAKAAGFNDVVRIWEEEIWYDPAAAIAKVRDAQRMWGDAAAG